jgi:hypothetical protein
MEKPTINPELPTTDSIAELARFWSIHDLTDLEDQLEEVTDPIFEQNIDNLSVDLDIDRDKSIDSEFLP